MSILSEKLREKRRASGLKVHEVLDLLKNHEIIISDKTLYNWENGSRNPNADEFFALCEIYEVESLDEFRETKKSPAAEAAEDDRISVDELKDLLRRLGYLRDGRDNLTEKDVKFISGIFDLLDAWFG